MIRFSIFFALVFVSIAHARSDNPILDAVKSAIGTTQPSGTTPRINVTPAAGGAPSVEATTMDIKAYYKQQRLHPTPTVETAPAAGGEITVADNDADTIAATSIKLPEFTQVRNLAYTIQRKDTRNAIIQLLTSAKKTIDIAAYIIDDPEIIKAIESAKSRGVTIRLFIQKADALQGKNSATENHNIQDIAYQTTKITTYFLPDLSDTKFQYSVQKMAYIIVDDTLVSILTRLPLNQDQQYFTQGVFLQNRSLAASLKKIMNHHVNGEVSKIDDLQNYLYNKSQLIVFGGEKGRDQLKEWCRFSTKSIVIQTQKLDDINFVTFLLQMRKMGRDIKIITSKHSAGHTLESLCIEKGIEIKTMNNISGTVILLDHDTDLAHMFIGNTMLSTHDFHYARSLGWIHKNQQMVKNAYLIFDTLWKNSTNFKF